MCAMKPAAFLALILVSAVSLFAQDFAPLPPPPDVVGVPFYLDMSVSELKKLSPEPYKEHAGGSGLNKTFTVEMQGKTSSFRIPAHNKIAFVYDATTMPRLYKFTVKGSKREFPYEKRAYAFFGNSSHDSPIDGIAVSVSRYKETAYQFSSDQPLDPGEYAIIFGAKIYTFGVDEKK